MYVLQTVDDFCSVKHLLIIDTSKVTCNLVKEREIWKCEQKLDKWNLNFEALVIGTPQDSLWRYFFQTIYNSFNVYEYINRQTDKIKRNITV